MKIIIPIALVSTCLCCWVCGDEPTATNTTTMSPSFQKCDKPLMNEHSGDGKCLMTGITNLPDLFKDLIRLACRFINREEDKIEEFHQKVFPEIKEIMRCFGCGFDTILGTGESLEEFFSQGADVIEVIGRFVNKLFTHFSASDCFAFLVKDNLPALYYNLNTLICEAQNEKLDIQLILQILNNFGCLADEALKTGRLLENATQAVKDLFGELLRDVINTFTHIIDAPGEVLICAGTSLVNNVINGTDGGNVSTVIGGIIPAPIGGERGEE